MKAIKHLTILLIITLVSGVMVYGQEKGEIERAKEIRELEKALEHEKQLQEKEIRQIMEMTRKSIEQSNLKAITEQQLKTQEKALEQYKKSMDLWQHNWSDSNKAYRFVVPTPRFEPFNDESFTKYRGINSYYDASDATQLDISKEIEDLDYSNDFTYEVPEGSHSISINVNGKLKDGELIITVIKPSDEIMQEITISPLADVSWNQSLSWKEKDGDDFIGTWTIEIEASEATGSYKVSLRNR